MVLKFSRGVVSTTLHYRNSRNEAVLSEIAKGRVTYLEISADFPKKEVCPQFVFWNSPLESKKNKKTIKTANHPKQSATLGKHVKDL